MTVFFVLTIIFTGLFMLLAFSMITVSTMMIIIAIHYSFVKCAGLLFSMFWKLKKSAM